MSKKILIGLMVGLILGLASPAAAVQVYYNQFTGNPGDPVGSEWTSLFFNPLLITQAPISPKEKFLGTDKDLGISRDFITFSQSGFNTYIAQGLTSARIEFDLYIIHSWDGNNSSTDENGFKRGPDRWQLRINGQTYVNTTFSNIPTEIGGYNQSYSDSNLIGSGDFAPKTGNDGITTLVYDNYFGTDTTYHFDFTVPLALDQLNIDFIGLPTQAIADESWGIDNLRISAIPIPASVLLLGSGLIGLGLLGWRRRQS